MASSAITRRKAARQLRNPDTWSGVRYFLELAGLGRDRFEREAAAEGIRIEKRIMKDFVPGAGSPLPQYTVTLPDGARGYFVPRRGFPGGKQAGKVWYEWFQLPRENPVANPDKTPYKGLIIEKYQERPARYVITALDGRPVKFTDGGDVPRFETLSRAKRFIDTHAKQEKNPGSEFDRYAGLLRQTHLGDDYVEGSLRLLRQFHKHYPDVDLEPAILLSVKIAAVDGRRPGVGSLAEALQYTDEAQEAGMTGEQLLREWAAGNDPTGNHREPEYRGGGIFGQGRAKQILGQANPDDLPERTSDTMSEAIALSSPSGRMSKRARRAAEKRLATALFGPSGRIPRQFPAQPPQSETLRRRARELRELAARGMSVRKFTKEADKLEAQAAELERAGNPSEPPERRITQFSPLWKEEQRYTIWSRKGDRWSRESFATGLTKARARVTALGKKYKRDEWAVLPEGEQPSGSGNPDPLSVSVRHVYEIAS